MNPYAAACTHLAASDPVMAQLVNRYPLPGWQKHTDYYEEIVSSIISQQLSVKAAATIQKRLCALFGDDSRVPSAQQLIIKTPEELRSVGLSYQKAGYILDLADKVITKKIHLGHLDELSNEEIIKELTQIKGVGEWTVHMLLIFAMCRLDVLPHGDLGVRSGATKSYGYPVLITPGELKQLAVEKNWHPYESVAAHYLWQSLG